MWENIDVVAEQTVGYFCIDVTLLHHLFIRLCIPSILHHYPPYLGTPPSTYIIKIPYMELPDLFGFRVCVSFLLVQCPRPWQLALSNNFVHNFIFCRSWRTVLQTTSHSFHLPRRRPATGDKKPWNTKECELRVTCKCLMRSRMSERGHSFFPL